MTFSPSDAPADAASPAPLPPALTPPLAPVRSSPRRFASLRTILALVLREMSTRYGRTPGGYLWNVLEPLAAILFLSLGFSLLVRDPGLGTSFLLFYATGYVPFDLYINISRTSQNAINFSRPLLRYPAVTWLDAVLARFLLNALTGLMTAVLLIGGIMLVINYRTTLDMLAMVEAMALTMCLGLGVGTLNCVVIGLFPLWDIIWNILNRPLFLASGIFFLYEDLPPVAQDILWYNPLMHITALMRTGFYPTYHPGFVSHLYVLLLSMALLALGLILMGRFHRDILNR